MFTGIVEELGTVVSVAADRLVLNGPLVTRDVAEGDSIAVNGVCLTVVAVVGDRFTADVMAETWKRSALGELVEGDPVNLERAALPTTRLGGHLVQGHVDAVGQVAAREAGGDGWESVRFTAPPPLMRYLVEKGSITVDGVSLTVIDTGADWFTVGLIPTTLQRTTLGRRQVGDPVNLEVDIIAKYVEKMVSSR
ncbi:riboflavin synthase [Virgisporangium ochraceum]|uniref:Riboflavin synthase n=1 Tax=Virgisporangium ochraceum TaxID=65505 RepID=A0A8J4A4X0_9ACTN|nr:riboflavin synthase [Virgisporangium ochraceum]GIJ75181.1 riboflavin synthase subunit alpha [Virgisporangium ochraceum]